MLVDIKLFDYEVLYCSFFGVWMVNNGYLCVLVIEIIVEGKVDLVVFGCLFISMLDFVCCLSKDVLLNELCVDKFYGGGVEGYIDYLVLVE